MGVIAISKLTATRDDASRVVELNNIANCINDIGMSYTSKSLEDKDSSACKSVKCASIDIGNVKDGEINVTLLTSLDGSKKFCDEIQDVAKRRGFEGVIIFSGTRIKD